MQKLKELEGLRGIAALVVLFHHLTLISFLPEKDLVYNHILQLGVPPYLQWLAVNTLSLLINGELAVWVFWVMSAYVISIAFFSKKEGFDELVAGYFTKRYVRLFIPVLGSVLFAYLLLKFGLMFNHELADLQGEPYLNHWLSSFYVFDANLWSALKSAAFTTFFNYQRETTYNAVLWTIQNEFLGSLFIFGLFGVMRHNKMRFVVYTLVLLVLLKLKITWLSAFVMGFMLSDFDYFPSSNAIIQYIKSIDERVKKYPFALSFITFFFLISFRETLNFIRIPKDYHYPILCVFLLYTTLRNEYLKMLFSTKPVSFLGEISFSLYLVHLPILCSLGSYLFLQTQSLQGKLVVAFASIVASVMVATVFNKFIDRNSITLANKVGDFFRKNAA